MFVCHLSLCSVPVEAEPSSPEPEPESEPEPELEREPLLPLPTATNGAEAAISEAVKNLPDDVAENPLKANSTHQDDASSTSSSAKSRSRSKSNSRSRSRSKSRSRSPRNRGRSPRNRRRSHSRSPRRRRYMIRKVVQWTCTLCIAQPKLFAGQKFLPAQCRSYIQWNKFSPMQ